MLLGASLPFPAGRDEACLPVQKQALSFLSSTQEQTGTKNQPGIYMAAHHNPQQMITYYMLHSYEKQIHLLCSDMPENSYFYDDIGTNKVVKSG